MPDLTSITAQLVDARLAGNLERFVLSRRADGRSWRRISLDIRDHTGIDVTHETLRQWFADAPPGRVAS